jgi:hypothetical protein
MLLGSVTALVTLKQFDRDVCNYPIWLVERNDFNTNKKTHKYETRGAVFPGTGLFPRSNAGMSLLGLREVEVAAVRVGCQ